MEIVKFSENSESLAEKAIRIGLNIREDFWDDFIRVTNNVDALAELLDVAPERISSWASRIQENLTKVQQANSNGKGDEKPKTTVLDTGDNF